MLVLRRRIDRLSLLMLQASELILSSSSEQHQGLAVLRTVDSIILGGSSLNSFQSALDLGECDAHVLLFMLF